jgi:hypothetical protein
VGPLIATWSSRRRRRRARTRSSTRVSVQYQGQENQRRSSGSGARTAARTAVTSRSAKASAGSADAPAAAPWYAWSQRDISLSFRWPSPPPSPPPWAPPPPEVIATERATMTPQRSSGERSAFSSWRLRLSSVRRSSAVDGPARARWSRSRRQPGSSARIRSVSARAIGSRSAATSALTSRFLPRWTATQRWPRSVSAPNQGHLVAGQLPKPGAPGRYAGSWHASYRLGRAQSGVRVSSARSRRNASASSSDPSARSGVSRHSKARRSRSSSSDSISP